MSKDRLEEIKYILESPGEVFFGDISSEGIVSQDVADAEPYFLWMVKRIDDLEEQNKRYREALEFYADKGTYEVAETLPPTDEYQQPIEPVFKTVPIIYYDKGKTARKALEGEE